MPVRPSIRTPLPSALLLHQQSTGAPPAHSLFHSRNENAGRRRRVDRVRRGGTSGRVLRVACTHSVIVNEGRLIICRCLAVPCPYSVLLTLTEGKDYYGVWTHGAFSQWKKVPRDPPNESYNFFHAIFRPLPLPPIEYVASHYNGWRLPSRIGRHGMLMLPPFDMSSRRSFPLRRCCCQRQPAENNEEVPLETYFSS